MSFTMNKLSAGVPASAIEIGGTFENQGEIYLRVKEPSKIGNVEVKLSKTDVVCLSLETFQLTILAGNVEVLKNKVTAEATMSYD